MKETSSTYITEEKKKFYQEKGYLHCEDFFSEIEIENILKWTSEIENFPLTKGKWMKFYDPSKKDSSKEILSRVENFFDYHEKFHNFFTQKNIVQIVSKLIGSEVVLFKDKMNCKYPGGDGFRAHQDATIWSGMYGIKEFISMIISIDESTLENGCLELSEGQHTNGLMGPAWKELPKEIENKLDWKPIITKPGDVVFFNDFMPHRSAVNNSNKSRRLIFLSYNKLSEGDHREQYFRDKRKNFPPNNEREQDKKYKYHI